MFVHMKVETIQIVVISIADLYAIAVQLLNSGELDFSTKELGRNLTTKDVRIFMGSNEDAGRFASGSFRGYPTIRLLVHPKGEEHWFEWEELMDTLAAHLRKHDEFPLNENELPDIHDGPWQLFGESDPLPPESEEIILSYRFA